MARRRIAHARLPDEGELAFPLLELGGGPGPVALFTGGIHGDEYEGPLALLDLARRLEGLPLAGRVLIVPFANAAALLAGTRTSPIDGANLARTFPGNEAGSPSARLAAALFALLDGVDLLVDSHSGGVALCFLPVAGFYPARDGVGAEAAAASRGMIPDDAAPRPCPPPRVLRGNWSPSPMAGLFRPLRALGESIRAGDPVARIETPLGEVVAELAEPHDGVLLAERNLCRVREGDLAILVAEVGEERA